MQTTCYRLHADNVVVDRESTHALRQARVLERPETFNTKHGRLNGFLEFWGIGLPSGWA